VDEALLAGGDGELAGGDLTRSEDRAILHAWRRWLANGGATDVRAAFYDTLDENLQDRVQVLVGAQAQEPPAPETLLREGVLDAVTRLRLRNLQRQVHELRFLVEDARDAETAEVYGPLITQATIRMRNLQQAMNKRSISGRRQREDAAVRMPFAEE